MDEFIPNLKTKSEETPCIICSQPTKEVCDTCDLVSYCSKEHQIAHWKDHQKDCLPYKILHNEILGRYGIAVRDLQPGEVVVKEKPVAIGPKHYSPPICLGCLTPILSKKDLRLCKTCRWPACSEECECSIYHANNECPIFAAARIPFLWDPACVGGTSDGNDGTYVPDNPMLQCITPLRLLLAKERDPKRWTEEVMTMEAHMKERRNNNTWNSDMVNVSGFLRKACRLSDRFSDEDIMWACGILQVNAFEARSGRGGSAQCLFPQLAIFSHSCVPNITHSIDSHFNMVGRVSIMVPRGQPLNTCYTHTLFPTLERREYLRLSKFFDCNCQRCADPTELGTNLSTLLCKNCSDSNVGNIISTNPLDPNACWQCNRCGEKRSVLSVELLLDSLENREGRSRSRNDIFDSRPDNAIELEEAFRRCSLMLHPNHSMLSCLRISLSQIYGNTNVLQLKDFLHIMLEHKLQLCEKIMTVADVIEPGLTRLRGTTLYELHSSVVILAQKEFNKGLGSYEEYYNNLKRAATFLEEAVAILSLEEPDSIEAKMCLTAKAKLYDLQTTLASIKTIHHSQISEKATGSPLKNIFDDFKLDLCEEGNKLQEAKDKDKRNVIEFIDEIKNVSDIFTEACLPVTLTDLTDIILSIEKESLEHQLSDLQIFQEMVTVIKDTNDFAINL